MSADPALAPEPVRPLAVTRLALTDFRCYRRLRLEAGAEPIVLTGPNGAGKTNLLEALSFLIPGRGLRRARLGEIDRRDDSLDSGPHWAVAATVLTPAGAFEIGTAHEPAAVRTINADVSDSGASESGEARDGRRIVRIDGRPSRGQASLARLVSMLWLTPDMDRLFLEGGSARRRFLDRLVYGFDPDHAGRVAAYDHAMRERTRLLRTESVPADQSWLTALEDRMAREGVAIAVVRRHLADRLTRAATLLDGPFPRPLVGVEGILENWLDGGPALLAEDRLRAALRSSRALDAGSGRASVGPHRSDLIVVHAEKAQAAAQCSTGEQKALLLSIILACARLKILDTGAPPVLLLDEVIAHLDATRRAALFGALVALGAQTWLTGTDEALFSPLSGTARFFRVVDAVVEPAGERMT
jgi:DNA replication and repair protein RecF